MIFCFCFPIICKAQKSGSKKKAPTTFLLSIAECFKNDTVSIKINHREVLHNYVVNSIYAAITNSEIREDSVKLVVFENGNNITQPIIPFGNKLKIKVEINSVKKEILI